MLKSIGIGAELFHELIESNSYCVDKTPFLRTVFKENTSKVMLITRPRRFGKTLTMSTFYDFLSLNIEKSIKTEYSLYIPNEEIRDCFRDKILN
ncbi:AAA family ATPase [Succinimonas amylolytica]|uniref:AAA family ATPase n=1 Tax=Succinimonas amylolytica TaxID=83769 RepID=UPI00037E5C8E|nr:AAA family ATPase [Succinimonas amylolytica]